MENPNPNPTTNESPIPENQTSNITVSPFDYSIQNHFNSMSTIRKLCGIDDGDEPIDQIEFEQLNSKITFLREWKHYYYRPRTIRFSCEIDDKQGKDVIGEVKLPQFSAATVPKYLAVAAHPPESSYHKVGSPLTGRGVIQIWCVVHPVKEEEPPAVLNSRLKKKKDAKEKDENSLKRPRGRPRKQALDGVDRKSQMVHASVAHSASGKEKNSIPSKTPKGKPKNQDIQESLAYLDSENEPASSFAVNISQRSSDVFNSTAAQLKSSNTGVHLDDSNRENQVVQVAVAQSCNISTTEQIPSKKSRGRPRKKKDIMESLVEFGTGNDSVPEFAVVSKVSSGFPALTEATKSSNELALLTSCDKDVELQDLSEGKQVGQETALNVSNVKEKKAPSLKKGRGRPRKQNNMTEPLVDLCTENMSVPALAIDVSSEYVTLDDSIIRTEEYNPLESYHAVGLDDTNRKNEVIQTTPVQVSKRKGRKSLPLKKSIGRPRKKKDGKGSLADLDTENKSETLPVDISQVSSGLLTLTDATIDTSEPAPIKIPNTDLGLYDLNRENQMTQAMSADLCNKDKTDTHPSKKGRGQRSKTRNDINDSSLDLEPEKMSLRAFVLESPHEVSHTPSLEDVTRSTREPSLLDDCDMVSVENLPLDQWIPKRPTKKRKMKDTIKAGSINDGIYSVVQNQEDNRGSFDVLHDKKSYFQDTISPSRDAENIGSLPASSGRFDPPNEIGLPRVVLCLAHNGKVAWDVKWRPLAVTDVEHKNRMGYLAVLLGNGSLEVWEVPSPRAVEILYSSCKKEGTDPRFVKLEPVFRCSKLKSGDRHSIPLTVEWSSSSPHDLLLVGCHDGTVALWKFSANGSSQDTRPLLCFSADTLPIRALAWAPDESDEESANTVVTAGHGGVRFWDLRDPYRPLCDVNPVRRFIYSLDWLKDPRCVIMSFDDGTVRLLSLSKASNDLPVTGKPFVGTQQQGFHSYFCSSSPIWSVQASKATGQVVYCSADGSVLHFQLTSKAVDKDSSRYRAPHFLCGSLTEEDATLTVNTPLANSPVPMKKPLKGLGENRSIGALLSESNRMGRTNNQTLDDEPLALCYGDDPSFAEDTVPVSKAKSTPKTNKKKKTDPDSVPVDNQEEAHTDIEVLPPKIVAMHRVRWNMNKGSERWVCYGGAAGIVRCQEISLSAIGARSLSKK
ncbi:hypothetical protein ACHQM5_008372 [Ranunculus cassubicifolius]